MSEFRGYKNGVNMGGWLSQCDHSKERYDTFVTEKDFETVKSWGLDHVRIPIDYEVVEDKDGTPIESGHVYIQNAIDWCRKYGLNMILDLHKTAGFSFDSGEKETGFFESDAYQERFYKLWERLAEKYGKYEDMLSFELLNEVTDKAYCEPWNRISNECIKRIRKIAPTIHILVGGYYNNSVEAVKDLAAPYDENIVYNFHCYEPLIFTHQGAGWIEGMDTSFRISVDAPYGEMDKACREYVKHMGITGFEGLDPGKKLDAAYFEDIFKEAVEVAKERGVNLYCGEYGVIDNASPEDTLKWYTYINAAFEKYGINRAAWSYRKMDFGLSDERLDGIRDELVKYL